MIVKKLEVFRVIGEMQIFEAIEDDGTVYPIQNYREHKFVNEGDMIECEIVPINDSESECRIISVLTI